MNHAIALLHPNPRNGVRVMTRRVLMPVLAAFLAVAATPYRDTAMPGHKLDGVWRLVSIEYAGTKWQSDSRESRHWIIHGDQVTIENGQGIKTIATVRWDTTHKPPRFDVVDEGRITLFGIYRIVGSKLTICAGAERRPEDLSSKPMDDERRIVLERR
jgi:uncharacterized protein (TIGR03067 family)